MNIQVIYILSYFHFSPATTSKNPSTRSYEVMQVDDIDPHASILVGNSYFTHEHGEFYRFKIEVDLGEFEELNPKEMEAYEAKIRAVQPKKKKKPSVARRRQLRSSLEDLTPADVDVERYKEQNIIIRFPGWADDSYMPPFPAHEMRRCTIDEIIGDGIRRPTHKH